MSVIADDSDARFVVTSVTGYGIRAEPPSARPSGARKPPPTSFYVLDRLDAYRVVGDFTAPIDGGATKGAEEQRRQQAIDLAAKLNAWHDADGWQDVQPMEVIA